MKQNTLLLLLCFGFCQMIYSQSGINVNGQLDAIEEFSDMKQHAILMPDGIKLMTDIYSPMTQDCLIINIDLPDLDLGPLGSFPLGTADLEVIPRGTPLVYYDSLNGQVNPNPFQYPMMFTRTPYSKKGDVVGRIVSLMGFNYALQDMRGRYTSGGVYMPMFSDSWNKNAYHNQYKHVLDVTPLSDPRNGNRHEDGYNSVKALSEMKKMYDLDEDGIPETESYLNNGAIGMFGASALGNTQLQAAAAHKVNPLGRGLKCLFPIVATNEHYRYTGYQNGVFRERIVTGWLRGQIADTDDNANAYDFNINDSIHSSNDYNAASKFVAANRAIDHFTTVRYDLNGDGILGNGELGGYYPNSVGRADMDASRAMVNADGESVAADGFTPLPGLTYNRYNNMDVPAYHLTGWWDIFIDGQLQTWRMTRQHLKSAVQNEKKQKIVIGPWAHQTIGGRETGDMTYPDNVGDIIGFAVDDVDFENLDVNKILQSEIIAWFRLNLNNNENYNKTGAPKIRIPESDKWQETPLGADVRVPSQDFVFPFEDLINFVAGTGGLKNLSLEIKVSVFGQEIKQEITLDVPALGSPLIPGFGASGQVTAPKTLDYNDFPNVRFYVPGPVNDGVPQNANVGNYWVAVDTFPFTNGITWQNYYLHKSGAIDKALPSTDEGAAVFVDDPNDPVWTVGGANMIVETPQGDRMSQGQMQMNSPELAPYCLDRPGVLKFETAQIQDSLCIIGYPKVTLYARSNPAGLTSGETDADYFVRVIDEYPDGREFFVFEGCVNARARDYARHIYQTGNEDPNIPYSNIQIGQVYEYQFEMMPIAYTWGKNHKMKIVIQGSNNPRYQSNPHIPLNPNEFFRRQPGDGQGYTFNGEFMLPRTSVERVYFAPDKATRIELPVFKGSSTTDISTPVIVTPSLQVIAYPNPAHQSVAVSVNMGGKMQLVLSNLLGQSLKTKEFREDTALDISDLAPGIYTIQVTDESGQHTQVKKISVY
ncbi:MAG: CocE/NonD family hydrolase [Bacteroidia bacterium]|nr:CocE/NonD family hydrolase [Bacteroidia bacterium]